MKNKKIMIIVPHEDDELNLAGGILNSDIFDKDSCYIVFMTNGDFDFKCKTRIKEAKKSAHSLGIPFKNIIFLGYPDQYPDGRKHIYHTKEKGIFVSKNKHNKTYCEGEDEFHYQNYHKHALYNYDNLLQDFILLIDKYKPDIFFTVDFDSHPDHRCCSLCFDKALGNVLKTNKDYMPKVYKGFAYPTSYKSFKDFNNLNLESTKFLTEKYSFSKMQNPYYKWKERVRFPVGQSCTNKLLLNNKLYRNLKKHTSQILLLKNYDSIINSDQVFWERKTNNIALHSTISTSSGDGSYVNDFMLFDCKNILNGNNIRPELIDAAWIPDNSDLEKYIKFEFSTWQNINEIRLYQNVNSKKKIENIEIIFSDQTTNKYRLDNELTTVIKIQKEKIKWIKIKILDSNIINSGFSEIEILNNEQTNYKFVKVLDGDNFIYDNYIFSNLHINVYEYNKGNVRYLKENEYEIYINNQRIEANNLDKGKKKFELKVSLKEYPDICDKVVLKRKTFLEIFKHQLKLLFNKLIFGFDYFLARVINKIRKVYLNIKEKEKVENERK